MVEDYAFAYDCPSFSDRVLCLTTGPLPPEHSAQHLASAFAASSPSLSYDGAGTSGVASAREGPLAKRRKILNDEDLMVEESGGAPALTAIAHPPAGTLSAAAAVAAVAQPSPKRNVMIKSSKQRRKAARTLVSDSGDEEKLDTSAEGVEEKEQEQEEEEREEEEEGAGSAERQRDRRRKRRSASEEGQQNVVKIHVSGLLLAAKSRFFRSLFASGMKETHQREVWLQMSKEELRPLQDIIRFIYEGRLHASTFRSLVEVLITADKVSYPTQQCVANLINSSLQYDVPSAVDAASRSLATIHFTLEQCEEVLSLATPSQKALVSRCQEVLLDRFGNLDKVWEQDDFWQLSPAALRTLLDCDKCEISSENNLFHVLRTWLAKDKEERQGQLGHILPSIRWPMMDSHFLNDVVAQASWLQSCPSFQVRFLASNSTTSVMSHSYAAYRRFTRRRWYGSPSARSASRWSWRATTKWQATGATVPDRCQPSRRRSWFSIGRSSSRTAPSTTPVPTSYTRATTCTGPPRLPDLRCRLSEF
ncbi:uncharacterized protein ACA1_098170 [Acanthamoeba castellanii str. Neff]|uniref:BTB domain-containing protein n=1 Tax=Acanthamoeba castellanii (strain ATCC 30010 / Neff) TaxID=1257118 RepID=L8GJA5_ACACF|nr:uncharacterized protein ACA1_098170 [Acanthamoeba castellanii str. Neff]ELR13120.1 hypothetical protein ACA1_098170 [Acanthamoeba castellanii str. Neff]